MKKMFALVAAVAALTFAGTLSAQTLTDAEKADGWVSIFDGKSLDGWECNEDYNAFAVKDGEIVGTGPYCHLFYVKDKFKDFELKIDCKVNKGGNGGVYIKVPQKEKGWPVKGFELQMNSTHGDRVKSGSLYNIVKILKAPHGDGEWFTYHLIAKGNTLSVAIDDVVLYEYVDPTAAYPTPEKITEQTKRIAQEGFIALQQHDPGTVVNFRNIKVKKLK